MQKIQYSAQPDSVISDAVETASAPPPHPGSRFEVASLAAQAIPQQPAPASTLDSRFEVRGSRFEVRGSRFEVASSAAQAIPQQPAPASTLDSRFEVRSSRFEVASPAVQPSTLNPQPSFEPFPGETPRAFSAFMAFFDLGHARSLSGVAVQLGEKPATVKKWSSRFRWRERIQAFNAGLLQQHAEAQAALQAQQAADWSRRTGEFREREWAAAQKLGAVQCFLDSFGDRDLEKMTLSQVSRALQISSHIARQALRGAGGPEGPVLAPLQLELAAALKKAYGQAPASVTGNAILNPTGAAPAGPITTS